jgi:periplasmic copper chaperone A
MLDCRVPASYMCGMEGRPRLRFVTLLLTLLAAAAALSGASAEDFAVGAIEIGNPWARATPKGSTVAAGYMTISNKGKNSDRLIGGSSPVAGRFELHSMVMEQGIAKMRPVEGGLEIRPGETVELKPGALHVMLTGLKQPLEKGQKIKGTLEFEKAGKIDIEYAVEALGASSSAPKGHRH